MSQERLDRLADKLTIAVIVFTVFYVTAHIAAAMIAGRL